MVKNNPIISVVGLGKLGSPLAACLAYKGHHVIGVDVNPSAVEAFNLGIPPGIEPGLEEMLASSSDNLRGTVDFADAVASSDVTFIIVPTPSDANGRFDNRYVLSACESVAMALAQKEAYHLVVVVSTVMPGSTDSEIKKTLEDRSGKTCGVDFGLCYGPTFIALGSVIRNLLQPDYLLIGESDEQAGIVLENLYRAFCDNDPSIIRMNFVNAELTKLANNTYVSTKITFGNMLSQMCERLPGAHVDVVTSALGLDSRIGGKFLKGGLGYGGPCLVRDNIALSALANEIGASARLSEATDKANQMEVHRLLALIKSKRTDSGVVGVLGLSYKPETDVVEESQGLILARELAEEGIPVVAYDPSAMEQAGKILGGMVTFANSLESCIKQSQVVVITTPWRQFQTLDTALFTPPGSKVLIDCWRIVDNVEIKTVAEHVMLGVGKTVSVSDLDRSTVPNA